MPDPQRRRFRPSRRFLAATAVLTFLLASCADNATDDASSDPSSAPPSAPDTADNGDNADNADDADAPEARSADEDGGSDLDTADADAAEASAPAEGDAAGGRNVSIPPEISALAVGRQIIFTGDVVVEANDVPAATEEIIDAVFAAGGAVWGQDTRTSPDPRTVLTIRVGPADFDRVLEAISGSAVVVSQTITTDDVTEAVVDIDARIVAAESSVGRVQTLLDAATDLNTVFTLEEELGARQADLERLRGQRKTIGDQVALATITLTILELDPDRLEPEMDVVAWLGTDIDDACPGATNLSIGGDDTAVLCVNVRNTGEDTLGAIAVESPTFRLRTGDFTLGESSDGTVEELAPGAELILVAELAARDGFIDNVDARDGLDVAVEVDAVPAGSPAVELTAAEVLSISTDVPDPAPTFADALRSGWTAMISIVVVIMLFVGYLLPFLPFLALIGWLVVRHRRRALAGRAGGDPADDDPAAEDRADGTSVPVG